MAFTTYDNAPYLYRKSGGGGDKEIDKLVGGTIAWNQLVRNGNFADTSEWRAGNAEITISSNTLTFTATNTNGGPFQYKSISPNHVYWCVTGFRADNGVIVVILAYDGTYHKSGYTATGAKQTANYFFKSTNSVTSNSFLYPLRDLRTSNWTPITLYKSQLFDLTLMFGSTIADYVYSLEQSSQGSGLAWLRSYGFFTEDYYDYNGGELKSVSNLVSHDMTGKNLLNLNVTSKTQNGITFTVNADGSIKVNGTATSGNAYFTKTTGAPPKMTKGTTVTLSGVEGSTTNQLYLQLLYIGADGSTISITSVSGATTYTFAQDATFSAYWLTVQQGATHDNTMVYPQLEFGSTATSYEPYTLHSYPLGNVTLRGLPKLNGNALYYGGDTYESNGTVTRRYIALTLNGSESWGKEADGWISAQGVNSFYLSLQSAIQPNYIDGTIAVNATSNRLLVATYRDYRSGIAQPNWFTFTGGGAYIDISSTLSTVDEFKTWLQSNPVTVVYELKTPTTETADTYTNPQWADPNGTERYTLSSNAFPMPVGHETTYNTDMGSKTVNTQVNLSMTEPSVRQVYAKEGDTARVLNIHLDQTEEDGTLRILRPDGMEVTADAVLVPEFYDGLMAEIPSDATEIVGKCYCDVEQNGVSSMPFTLNVKKNERAT